MNKSSRSSALFYVLTALLIALSPLAPVKLQAQANEVRVQLPRSVVTVTPDTQSGMAHFTGVAIQYISRSGEPAIPYQVLKVLLPPVADLATVTATIENERLEPTPGVWDVAPVPPPVPCGTEGTTSAVWPQGKNIKEGRDVAVYQTDALFPPSSLGRLSSGNLRAWVLVDIPVALYRYNPVTKGLFQLTGGELVVRFTQKSEMRPNQTALADRIGEETVQRLAVNFAEMAPAYSVADAPKQRAASRYVIITTQAIKAASHQLAAFISSKEGRGFTVQVVTEETWGGGTGDVAAEHIRHWLQANYLDLNIEYVLLVGNPDPVAGDVPMKMLWPRSPDATLNSPSDYYYVDLTGNWDNDGDGFYGEWDEDFGVGGVDRNWEVLLGRIPYYGNITELDHILAKLLVYENSSATLASRRKNVLLPMAPSDANTPGYHLGEAIKNTIIVPKGDWGYHRVYQETYGLTPPPETTPINVEGVTNVWKAAPFGAIFWWTHGSSRVASQVMDTTHTTQLNDNDPGFVFHASCSTAYPEDAGNLSYSLLKNGASASVAATRLSWYFIGETEFDATPSSAGLAYQFAKRLISDEMDSGHALQELKLSLDPGLWMNWTVFNLYGDPSQSLFTTRSINVNSTADPGNGVCDATECTLREAITAANSQAGLDAITFNIPGNGPFTIQPTTPLPTITDPVLIDGYSQPQASPNIQLNPVKDGSSFTILIELDGSLLDDRGNGLDITAATGIVRGLKINHFPDAGIRLASPENGGGFTITGNMIGNDGNESRANGDGILLLSANNTVGGTTPDTYNVISGNTYAGIRIVAPNNRVLGNLIGVDADGIRELGNGVGIVVSGASNNLIGAENHPFGNVISFNHTFGLRVEGNATGNQLQHNLMFGNMGLGIELGNDGVTPNDPLDSDTGPNNLQNFPVLTTAEKNDSTLAVRGALNSTPNTAFHMEFFSSRACDPSGFGEGNEFLGTAEITTDQQGGANFTVRFAVPEEGPFVTAIATDPAGNTSEFAHCVETTQAQPGILYLSTSSSGKVSGLSFADEDILAYNLTTGDWSLFFDGSDVGLAKTDLDAFMLTNDGNLLLSLGAMTHLPDVGWVDDSDIVKFVPTSLGATTRGRFEIYFDGSDVGLTTANEDVDAFALAPDGRLIVSTLGSVSVPGMSGKDKDLLAFQPDRLGTDTRGQWALYFDGSDVGLTNGDEDLWGVWLSEVPGQTVPQLYLTTKGKFTVEGLQGKGGDIFICTTSSLGSTTRCTFSTFWSGAQYGLSGKSIDGFAIGQALPLAFNSTVEAADLEEEATEVSEDTAGDDVSDDDMDEDQLYNVFLPNVAR